MARYKSTYSQAIRDMLEEGIDITYIKGNTMTLHSLNADIEITTIEIIKAKPKPVKSQKSVIIPIKPHSTRINRSYTINPDGTISFEKTEWDFD